MGNCSVICCAKDDAIKNRKYDEEVDQVCREMEKKE